MRKALLFLWALGLYGGECVAQTNLPPSRSELFSVPPLRLREPMSDKSEPVTQIADAASAWPQMTAPDYAKVNRTSGTNLTDLHTETAVTREADDFDMRMFYRLDSAGFFKPPKARTESRFDAFMDDSFQPEVIHFRKVDVSCSLITAIKRKNPLCLINPIFFNLSW